MPPMSKTAKATTATSKYASSRTFTGSPKSAITRPTSKEATAPAHKGCQKISFEIQPEGPGGGGIGKKEDSANATPKIAAPPYGECAQAAVTLRDQEETSCEITSK